MKVSAHGKVGALHDVHEHHAGESKVGVGDPKEERAVGEGAEGQGGDSRVYEDSGREYVDWVDWDFVLKEASRYNRIITEFRHGNQNLAHCRGRRSRQCQLCVNLSLPHRQAKIC